jgi:hypothetical protein
METASSRIRRASLVFWMIALGLLAVYAGGVNVVYHWSVLVFGARLCYVLIAVSGVALLAAGIGRMTSQAVRRASCAVAAAGSIGFSATLFIGIWTGAIPCSGFG